MVVGEPLGEIVGRIAKRKLREGLYEFVAVIGEIGILPSVGVAVIVAGERAYFAGVERQIETLIKSVFAGVSAVGVEL